MAVILIVTGALIIAGLFAAGIYAMAKVTGWKVTLQIWAFSALVTAIAAGASLLVAYGIEHL